MMSDKPFAHDLIGELDRVLATIDQLAERMHRAVTTARDLAALAKRYVDDGEQDDAAIHDAIVRGEHAVHKAEQRRIEEGEQALEKQDNLMSGIAPTSDLILDPQAFMAGFDLGTENVVTLTPLTEEQRQPIKGRRVESKAPGEIEHAGFFIRDMEANARGEERYFDAAELGAAMLADGAIPVTVGMDFGQGESFSSGVDDALKQAYAEPMPDLAAPAIIADKIDATKIEDTVQQDESNPRHPPGEEKTGAAVEAVLPGPDAAASVDPIEDPYRVPSPEEWLPVDSAALAGEIFPEPGGRLIAPQMGLDHEVKRPAAEATDLYEQVLDLWSTTDCTEALIARRSGATISLVRTYLEQARADEDPRIAKRDSKGRLIRPKTKPAKEDAVPPVKGNSAPARNIPFLSREDVVKGDGGKPPTGPKVSSGVCVVDLATSKIYGKAGYWTSTPEIAKTIAHLNGGQCFSLEVLVAKGGWSSVDVLRRAITPMMERLRDIGVVMTFLPVGVHIKKAE